MSSASNSGAGAATVASNIGISSYTPTTNPLDGSGAPTRPSTTSLTTLLLYAQRQHDKEFRKVMPARVEKLHSDFYVDVQPGFSLRYRDDNVPVPLPIIPQVPVLMIRGADYGMHIPVAVGDTGVILVMDRAIDSWLASADGDTVDPGEPRLHNLADAVFLPGLSVDKQTDAEGSLNGKLQVRNGLAKMTLQKTGQVSLGNGKAELVSAVQQLAVAVSAIGKQVPVPPANIDVIIGLLNSLKA